ncbi:TPA: hypothetical protein ACJJXJ_000902 [Enterobacter soli]
MSKSASSHPHTAAPTWSGFIYQGHLALYHSIECVLNKMSFELQIDSIDDFSIIENGIAVSTHQVKALADDKRAAYKEALEKAASTYCVIRLPKDIFIHLCALTMLLILLAAMGMSLNFILTMDCLTAISKMLKKKRNQKLRRTCFPKSYLVVIF